MLEPHPTAIALRVLIVSQRYQVFFPHIFLTTVVRNSATLIWQFKLPHQIKNLHVFSPVTYVVLK